MYRITFDHFDNEPVDILIQERPLYGIERVVGMDNSVPNAGPTVAFRLLDDDDELMLSGVLTDDDDCENQSAALRYGESSHGCTRILVKRESGWEQEIA